MLRRGRFSQLTRWELYDRGVALIAALDAATVPAPSWDAVRREVRIDLSGYWTRVGRGRIGWLGDHRVDLALTVLPRASALLRDGTLLSKTAAVERLRDIGVPRWLAADVARRREGRPVPLGVASRIRRAVTARRIFRAGLATMMH